MSANPGHVVILADDELVAATIGMIAEDAGFATTAASRFEDFWNALHAYDPSHIALDLSMPEVDGVEVLRRLADAGYRGSVISSSGLDRRVPEAARSSASEHGLFLADGCVTVAHLGRPMPGDAVAAWRRAHGA